MAASKACPLLHTWPRARIGSNIYTTLRSAQVQQLSPKSLIQASARCRKVSAPDIRENVPQLKRNRSPPQKKSQQQQRRNYQQQGYNDSGYFWRDNKPNIVLGGLTGLCGLVYVARWWAKQRAANFHDQGPLDYLQKNFTLSLDNFRAGRWWTMLTASIMHGNPLHLGLNMLMVWEFGRATMSLFGGAYFASIWVSSAILCSWASLYWKHVSMEKTGLGAGDSSRGSIGSSGAISGLVAAHICVAPRSRMSLLLIPGSFPAWAFAAVFVTGSFACLITNTFPLLDHAGHLGGFAGGVGAYYAQLRPYLRRI